MNLHVDVNQKILQVVILASYLRKHEGNLKKAGKAADNFFHEKKLGCDYYMEIIKRLLIEFDYQIKALSLKGDRQHLKTATSFTKKKWEILSMVLCLDIPNDNYPFFLINPLPFDAIDLLIMKSIGKSQINNNRKLPTEPYVLFNVKIEKFKAIESMEQRNFLFPVEMGLLSVLTPEQLTKDTIIDPNSEIVFSEFRKNIQFSLKNEKMTQDYSCISAELRLDLEKLSA